MAPSRRAVAMAERPATPAPITKTRAGAIVPAAVGVSGYILGSGSAACSTAVSRATWAWGEGHPVLAGSRLLRDPQCEGGPGYLTVGAVAAVRHAYRPSVVVRWGGAPRRARRRTTDDAGSPGAKRRMGTRFPLEFATWIAT